MQTVAVALVAMLTLGCGGAAKPAASEPPGKVVVTDTVVEILDPISFVTATAELEPTSIPILDAIATTLDGNPSIKLITIHAHLAGTAGGDPAQQQQVAERRAQIVLDYLVGKQIAASRLQIKGTVEPATVADHVNLEVEKRGP